MAQTVVYRLRGGQIQPFNSSCATGGVITGFYSQTFGAEKIITDVTDAKVELLASSDFQGQKPTTTPQGIEDPAYIATTYTNASYQCRGLKTTDGDLVFSASEEHTSQFVEEEELGIV